MMNFLSNVFPFALLFVIHIFPRSSLIRVRSTHVDVETFNPWQWLLFRSATRRWRVQLLRSGYPMCTDAKNIDTGKTVGMYEWRGVRRAVLSVGEIRDVKEAADL